jgi:hypothetical protein
MAHEGTCAATRRDGQACTAGVVGNGRWCFAHDPALQGKREQARRRGGENRATSRRLQKLLPARLVPVFAQLAVALAETHAGTLDYKQAQAMAAVARAMAAVLQVGELEARVRELEERAS